MTRVFFVSETAQVELKSGRVLAPAISFRISRVAPHPSRTGMLQSMRMQSKGGCAWRAACTAASPFSTTVL